MRTIITLLFLIFTPIFSIAQHFTYPLIKEAAGSINEFIPKGWLILDSATGDLNKDTLSDVALVLQYADSITISATDAQNDFIITQPRILVILFKERPTGDYIKKAQNNTFILNHDNPNMDDPYNDIKISNGSLQIDFTLFYNMGSWYITNSSYKFRFQDDLFILIGADYYSIHRASLDFEKYSYNFLTNKRSKRKGNEGEGTESKTYWKTMNIHKLQNLQTFKAPFTWEVEKDIYL